MNQDIWRENGKRFLLFSRDTRCRHQTLTALSKQSDVKNLVFYRYLCLESELFRSEVLREFAGGGSLTLKVRVVLGPYSVLHEFSKL